MNPMHGLLTRIILTRLGEVVLGHDEGPFTFGHFVIIHERADLPPQPEFPPDEY